MLFLIKIRISGGKTIYKEAYKLFLTGQTPVGMVFYSVLFSDMGRGSNKNLKFVSRTR